MRRSDFQIFKSGDGPNRWSARKLNNLADAVAKLYQLQPVQEAGLIYRETPRGITVASVPSRRHVRRHRSSVLVPVVLVQMPDENALTLTVRRIRFAGDPAAFVDVSEQVRPAVLAFSGEAFPAYAFPNKKPHDYAEYAFTSSTLTASADVLLAFEDKTGDLIVLLPSGERETGAVFPVVLQQVGGSAGSATASATWTYRVITLDGTVLTDSVNPVGSVHRWRRPSPGRMVPANFEYAHYNASGAFVIGWINEVPEQERCG